MNGSPSTRYAACDGPVGPGGPPHGVHEFTGRCRPASDQQRSLWNIPAAAFHDLPELAGSDRPRQRGNVRGPAEGHVAAGIMDEANTRRERHRQARPEVTGRNVVTESGRAGLHAIMAKLAAERAAAANVNAAGSG